MAYGINELMKLAVKSVPLVIGLILYRNTQIISFLPVIVHQVVGIGLIVGGIMMLMKK